MTFCVQKFLSENRAFCEVMSKNMVELRRPHVTQQYWIETMHFAFQITNARI